MQNKCNTELIRQRLKIAPITGAHVDSAFSYTLVSRTSPSLSGARKSSGAKPAMILSGGPRNSKLTSALFPISRNRSTGATTTDMSPSALLLNLTSISVPPKSAMETGVSSHPSGMRNEYCSTVLNVNGRVYQTYLIAMLVQATSGLPHHRTE
jgi:hypothetical protein